jgi:hypothetical protein
MFLLASYVIIGIVQMKWEKRGMMLDVQEMGLGVQTGVVINKKPHRNRIQDRNSDHHYRNHFVQTQCYQYFTSL